MQRLKWVWGNLRQLLERAHTPGGEPWSSLLLFGSCLTSLLTTDALAYPPPRPPIWLQCQGNRRWLSGWLARAHWRAYGWASSHAGRWAPYLPASHSFRFGGQGGFGLVHCLLGLRWKRCMKKGVGRDLYEATVSEIPSWHGPEMWSCNHRVLFSLLNKILNKSLECRCMNSFYFLPIHVRRSIGQTFSSVVWLLYLTIIVKVFGY